jgi:GTP pyrophosphokinase
MAGIVPERLGVSAASNLPVTLHNFGLERSPDVMSAAAPPAATPPSPLDAAQARDVIAPLYVDKVMRTGEPYLAHAAGMVAIVRALRDDPDLVAAAWLFGAHEVLRDADDWLRARFGDAVAGLVGDLRQLLRLSERTRSRDDADAGQAEALRKMLLAMCNDLRVVLLRLASRLQTLRWYAGHPQQATPAFARETLALYAPLASRLGIWQLKWELEDLAFRIADPDAFARITGWLEEKRSERESSIDEAAAALRALLAVAGIRADVSGRPKHVYSIWNKMRAKQLAPEQVHDVRALRVIVDEIAACYQVLSLVHERFAAVPGEYDDYIARPKPNGYQSLHTVVLDARGRPLEIQIRTRRMHESAELGLAAHWRYKERGAARGGAGRQAASRSAEDERIGWLRQLLAWRDDVAPLQEQGPAVDDRIYVLTPQARVVELPAGATPIDFAYHVHTELGHRCRGARVDGAMVPLNTRLATGQTVEIQAAKTGGPSRDWLNPELGYLASARSRAKVRQWFNALELEQSVIAGREIVDRELQRLGRTAVKLEDLAHRLGFDSVEALCVAATKEEFSPRSIENALADAPAPAAPEAPPQLAGKPRVAPAGKGQVLVVGVDSLLTQLARCCRPVPPDEIVGFVTRGRGVSIHRAGCANAQALLKRQPERLIDVDWGGAAGAAYPVDILVVAQDRQGLLRDVSEVFAREKLNVVGVNSQSLRGDAHMLFTVEVGDTGAVRRALAQIGEVAGVLTTRRR